MILIYHGLQVPVVNEVQINVPKEVSKQIAIQDPDYEVIEEQTVMVQEQVPNPNYREPGTDVNCRAASNLSKWFLQSKWAT